MSSFPPKVLSDEETVDRIVEGRLSVARFGDGEYRLMDGGSIRTQRGDPKLAGRLGGILGHESRALLPCILDLYSDKPVADVWKSRREVERRYGTEAWAERHLWPGRVYGCAGFTRLCSWALGDRTAWWARVKRIWEGRSVMLVTGSNKGRVAMDSDLLDNAGSVKLWDLEQPRDCWSRYDEVLRGCVHWALEEEVADKRPLILAALGPTATVLAADCSYGGIQCVDIGHMPQSYLAMSPKEFAEA